MKTVLSSISQPGNADNWSVLTNNFFTVPKHLLSNDVGFNMF